MDIDRFLAAHSAEWERLAALTSRAGRDVTRLSADELDELVRLYQHVSTHLSTARTRLRDEGLVSRLTTLTARAGAVLYGSPSRTWRGAFRFVADTFPAALWHARAFTAVSAFLLLAPALAIGVWIAESPAALEAAVPAGLDRAQYVEEDFEAYYSSTPAAQFASTVTTNNIRVGILAFGGGVLLCLPTAYVLVLNGANLGFAAGLFAAASQQPRFWGLILPHGMLELTAVVVAGAIGLRLGWAVIDPGDRGRGEALTEEGRRAVVVVIGLVAVFVVAGLIEAFVTGSTLPTWARVGVGAVAEAAFVVYVVVRGRAAAARGLTGAIGEQDDVGWAQAT